MKTTFIYVFAASLLASTGAFAPVPLATRAVGKKPVVKEAPVSKKAPVKNPFAKNPFAKKPVEKKSVEKKSVGKKPVGKKPVAKKSVAKKPVAKKLVAKKPAAKKPVAKKPVIKKFSAKKKSSTKKVVTVKKVKKSGPPSSGGYPSFRASTEAWKPLKGISGGGNKAPLNKIDVPDLSNPALQKKRDPSFYAKAALKRKENLYGSDFIIDDGLTVIERTQRKTLPTFLTGSANSRRDESLIRSDIVVDPLLFGLDQDRFQLVFIAIFGLFTLVGCLSGTIQL